MGSPRALGLGAGWRSGNFDMIRSDAVPGKKLSPVILENHAGGAGGGVLLQSVRRNWACEMDRPWYLICGGGTGIKTDGCFGVDG